MLKKIISKLDKVFLKNKIKKYKYKKKINEQLDSLESGLDYKFIVHYAKNHNDILSGLCDKYGSDKGALKSHDHPYPWPSHTYADYYSRLFSHCRMDIKKVFECGLGTNNQNLASSMGADGQPGASLRVWRDYFPNAYIYGADIDKDILFNEDRIKTFYVDQLNPTAIEGFWREVGDVKFDIMIDDGLHTFDAGCCLFTHSIHKLSSTGIYVIEDVNMTDLKQYKNFFNSKNYVVEYITMFRPNIDLGDNNLVVVRKSVG